MSEKVLIVEGTNATHLYTEKVYRQVETTPLQYLAQILKRYFLVKEFS